MASRSFFAMLFSLSLACLAGCNPNFIPAFEPVEEQTVYVGEATSIPLRAMGGGSDVLSYAYEARREGFKRIVVLQDRKERDRPQLQTTKSDGSEAVFVWRPTANDTGTWVFTFLVSQGGGPPSQQEVRIVVLPSREGVKATFLEPTNEGVDFRVDLHPCLEVPVRVLIPALPDGVRLSFRPANLENAVMIQLKVPQEPGLFEGTFKFCPSPEQIEQVDIYTIYFTATVVTDESSLVKPGQVLGSKVFLVNPAHPALNEMSSGQAPETAETP